MAKLDYLARTLDDVIIKDGLSAVSTLSKQPKSKDHYMVVGGIAVQSYLPSSCRRNTSDIDICLDVPLSYSEFKEFSKSVAEYLQDNEYNVIPHKGHLSYNLEFISKSGDASQIEFSRRTNGRLERKEGLKKRLQRELENRRTKIIEGCEDSYEVCSPEDIGAPKLVRSINSLNRNPSFIEYVNKLKGDFNEDKVKETLEEINSLRREAIYHIGDIRVAQLSEELRFAADVYDMRILSELVGFNKKYLEIVIRDWDTIRKEYKTRDKILSGIFPQIDFEDKRRGFLFFFGKRK